MRLSTARCFNVHRCRRVLYSALLVNRTVRSQAVGESVPSSGTPQDDEMQPESTPAARPPPNLFVVAVYYAPLLLGLTMFFLMTEFRVVGSTSLGAVGGGIMVGAVAMFGTSVPAVGLLVGWLHLGMDFVKGFVWNAVVGLTAAFLFYALSMGADLFGDVMDGTVRLVVLSMLPPLFAPVRYHLKRQHRRALGAAHAAPLAFMLVFFGLLFAWLSVYDAG